MSGGHTEVMIRMMPPATNAPPDMTPRELLRGDGIAAIAHTLMPTATRIVPIVLRGRAVLRSLSAASRRPLIRRRRRKRSKGQQYQPCDYCEAEPNHDAGYVHAELLALLEPRCPTLPGAKRARTGKHWRATPRHRSQEINHRSSKSRP